MALPTLPSSGEKPISASTDWADVLNVEEFKVEFSLEKAQVNWISLLNEGDTPGFWRLVSDDGKETPSVRLPVGAGELGNRRSSITIPCPGFSGKLQVKAEKIGESLTGIFAFGMK